MWYWKRYLIFFLLRFWQNAIDDSADVDFSVWEAPASLKRCIVVILRIKLKQSYCEKLESVPAVFPKLSWNFHLSLSCCSALAGNRQYIAGLSIHSRDVALPSERKNPIWVDWTIEISPSIRWVLLSWFPARMLRFWVSHHAAFCAWRPLTSYRPVVHTCPHFSAHVRRRHRPGGTARAPPQVP